MSVLLPFIALDQTCDEAQMWAVQELTRAGFRVVQTFDLQVARLAHPDCSCPNHGTEECNCQMVVFLIYQEKNDPATLVIHGQEANSWLSLMIPEDRLAYQRLAADIQQALGKYGNAVTLS